MTNKSGRDTNQATDTVKSESDDELWRLVDEHLLHYGRDFVREFIGSASGSFIHGKNGRAIIDFSSGQMCATLGHNHEAIVAAVQQACDGVFHLDSTMLSPAIAHLAKELCDLLPAQLSKVLFLNTGAESNEAAIRLAKLYTGGFEIIGLTGSWHGTTQGAASSTYASGRKGYGPGIPGTIAIPAPNCYRCPLDKCPQSCGLACLDFGFDYIDTVSVDSTAAVMVEPIQSAGGIIVPPPGYLQKLRELCDARSMLLIFDEAQTGLGRVGANFALEQEDDALVRVVARAVVSGKDRHDLDARSLERSVVGRHDAEQAPAIRQPVWRAERLHRAALLQGGQRPLTDNRGPYACRCHSRQSRSSRWTVSGWARARSSVSAGSRFMSYSSQAAFPAV